MKESLSEIERALTLHSTGTILQKLSVLHNLASIFRDHKKEATDKLLPKICNIASKNERDFQAQTAHALLILLNEKLIQGKAVSDYVMPTVLKLLRHRDEGPVPVDDWCDVLIAGMPLVSTDFLRDKVVGFAKTMGELAQPVANRLLACNILGALAKHLDGATVEAQYLRLAMDLCQDTDFEVRTRMARALEHIARAVGLHAAKAHHLLRELLELLGDEESSVKRAALTTFIDLLPFYDMETRITMMVPVLKNYCKSLPEDLAPVIGTKYGDLFTRIVADLEDDEVVQIFSCYRALGRHRLTEIRRLAAVNFTTVLQCLGTKRFTAFMFEPLQQLSLDETSQVRRAIATIFPSVVEMLGKEKAVDLKDIFAAILKDTHIDVKEVILDHISAVMAGFACNHREKRAAVYASLCSPLLECHSSIAHNWRLQQRVITQFASIHLYLSPQTVTDKFIPLIQGLMSHVYAPQVREAAAAALCRLVRWSLRSPQKRRDLCARLIEDYARGRSYWDRILFVNLASAMANVFSRRFFKDHFFDAIMDMAADSVPNVRMKMCSLCPILKRMIKLPDDAPLLKKLNTHLAHLKNDRDRDVSQAATLISEKVAAVETSRGEMECEDDLIDYKKEEEEDTMFRAEERELEESKRRDEEARSEFRRKLEQNEAEKVMRAKIFGTKHTNKPKPKLDEPISTKAPFPATKSSSFSPSSPTSVSPVSPTSSSSPRFLPSVATSISSPPSSAAKSRPRTTTTSPNKTTMTPPVYLRRISDPQLMSKINSPKLTPLSPSTKGTKLSTSLSSSPISTPPIKNKILNQPPISQGRSMSTSHLSTAPVKKNRVVPM